MSQRYIKHDRVSLNQNQNILDVLYKHTGGDGSNVEALFYELNPTVISQHIPSTGFYLIPIVSTESLPNENAGLLLWG